PGYGKIEAAPKEMNRADFADETRAELLQHAVYLDQGTPEAVRVDGVVSAMDAVLAEGNSARYLRGQLGDFDRDLQMVQVPNDKRVELGNGARLQRDASLPPVTGDDLDEMLVEVEFDLKNAVGVRNGRCAEPARCDIEGYMPGMIEPWRRGEPYLAGDLRPKMQRLAGIFPGFVRQLWPEFVMR